MNSYDKTPKAPPGVRALARELTKADEERKAVEAELTSARLDVTLAQMKTSTAWGWAVVIGLGSWLVGLAMGWELGWHHKARVVGQGVDLVLTLLVAAALLALAALLIRRWWKTKVRRRPSW